MKRYALLFVLLIASTAAAQKPDQAARQNKPDQAATPAQTKTPDQSATPAQTRKTYAPDQSKGFASSGPIRKLFQHFFGRQGRSGRRGIFARRM